jgi:hypothetical protein
MPELGSMVQKGKFSAAIPALVSALNSVDLPTLGRPTIPHCTGIFSSRFTLVLSLLVVKD